MRRIFTFAFASIVFLIVPVLGSSIAKNQVIIKVPVPLTKFKPPILDQLPSFNIETIIIAKNHPEDQNLIYRLFFTSDIDVENMVARLNRSEGISWAKPNKIIVVPQASVEDPFSPSQNYLEQVKIPEAWRITSGNQNVVVAVIDTGIYFDHDDLKNKIWSNPGEIPSNNIDDDHNGKVDDTRGWDFVTSGPVPSEMVSGEDYSTEDNDPSDRVGHGTEVSGVIAAESGNGKGIKGVGGNTEIMPLRAGYAIQTSSGIDGEFDTVGLYNAIIYAVNNKAKIINLSLGGIEDETCTEFCLDDAIAYAVSKNSLVVAAAGNGFPGINIDTNKFIPASLPGVLTVSSVGSSNRFSSFSNFGPSVGVAAPGEQILTTGFVTDRSGSPLPNGYVFATGTSLATPIVSGIAALILSEYPTADIKAAIAHSTTGYDGSRTDQLGFGIVNALAAVAYFDNSPPEISHIPVTQSSGELPVTISATIRDNLEELIPPTARVKYREITDSAISDWKSISMTRNGTSFTGIIFVSGQNVQKIDYAIEASDSNPNRIVSAPSSGTYQVVLKDLTGPKITSVQQQSDYVQIGNEVTVNISDNSGISTSSISVQINSQPTTAFTFSKGVLTIPISQLVATSNLEIKISVQDILGNRSDMTLQLKTADLNSTLLVTGPSGGNTILSCPNPFIPANTSTKIAFQSSLNGKVELTIWSRYFEKVVQMSEIIRAGYTEIVWDGRSPTGGFVPPGVYFGILTVTSDDGQQRTKRIKIGVKSVK